MVGHPDQPLPALAYDGLPLPSTTLNSLLSDTKSQHKLQQLAQHAFTDGASRERMTRMLSDSRVRRRLREMEAQVLEDPALLAKFATTFVASPHKKS